MESLFQSAVKAWNVSYIFKQEILLSVSNSFIGYKHYSNVMLVSAMAVIVGPMWKRFVFKKMGSLGIDIQLK